ncbi:MAG: GAF domain-containing protein [SAR324 cluster bacterium]|nr:GAF domain-containing protein [SAR324 cluster bacterium]
MISSLKKIITFFRNDQKNDQSIVDLAEKYRITNLLLHKLNNIGVALSIEKNISVLLEKILIAAKEMTRAEGGTIYMYKKEVNTLKFEIMLNDVLNTHYGGTGENTPPFPELAILNRDGKVNENMIAAYSAGYKTKVNIKDAYSAKGFDFTGTKNFDKKIGYRSRSFLTVPMLDAKQQLLGVLQLINPRHQNGKQRVFDSFDEDMVESLTSQASVALSNRILLDETRELFESIIKMINLALDEKSPYTNEHCQKVPIITMMLAQAVCDHKKGPLRNFDLTEDGKNELRIAALLHDCGKIVTPVHVIDKAKKLELLEDRFDIISTKADAVDKDIEIAISQSDSKAKHEDLLAKRKELRTDLQFLKSCNIGSESLNNDDLARLKDISKKWYYTDSTNKKRYLIDKRELNFLSIFRGTLTPEEREVVNYHVVASIKMLESLPWPEYLKRVPEYAGGHHERIDGKGYPKGLTGDQMSVPSRIMAIADVFEALTSSNRPYKGPAKLSESLKIMDEFIAKGHLDPDLYEIFMQQKVYKKYAKEYMKPEQNDVQ